MFWGISPPHAPPPESSRAQQILTAKIHLLFANANVGVYVTFLAATLLAYLQWSAVSHRVVSGWWLSMILVSICRYTLTRRYKNRARQDSGDGRWAIAFALGAGMAGLGWGCAGILLYPSGHLTNQVFLVFVLGGMMLGGASLLAPRQEAFLAFIVPAGLIPAARLLYAGDQTHLAMGLLAVVFTAATLATTANLHRTIDSSLRLRFENGDLVEELQTAKHQTEALNQQLERRVEERTDELHRSNERLRAEISQREQAEEELIRARKLESLGVLAGGVAHDFNNFLTVVSGNVEMIRLQLESGEPLTECLDQIAESCRRATFLASQLLTFAKGGAPVRRVTSVAKLVFDSVHLARAGTSVSFDVNVAPDLLCAELDASQIIQVLHNILVNARQAMADGGIIEVRAENVFGDRSSAVAPVVRILIRDYGTGIAQEVLPRIFDPYFTTKPGGSGLGLATVYAIVAKHGGQISVESVLGRGTTFMVDLPASLERPSEDVPAKPAAQHRTERLLVMDDEDALQRLLTSVLTKCRYRVQTAGDGAEAVAVYEAAIASGQTFDACLLDLTVHGGMGGIEAASKIRELDASARLIASSGYSDSPVMAEFRRFGFDGVIPKPWSATELIEVFRRVLAAVPDRKAF